jgi:glycosyltransferase involved in cell wall biosynthesis
MIARVPVRLGSRRDISLPERTSRNRSLQTASYRLAHRVVANSAAARSRLVDEGVASSAIAVIPNGIDLRRFSPPPSRPRGRRVVMVANLRPGKGHEILLEAAAAVLRNVPDARFTIAGDGPRKVELQRMARELGVDGAVTFLGHRPDVPALLREHDVFAFPSFMEAAPNAVMEAMAAGLPVVTTRVGGIPEVVHHEKSGLLTDAGDAAGLALALRRVLTDDALAGQMAAAGRELIETRYSFERMTREFEGLYLSELATHAPAALASAASSSASPRHAAAR